MSPVATRTTPSIAPNPTQPPPGKLGGRWQEIATSPIAAYGANAFWTGAEMIVWGGLDASAAAAYNPKTDRWRRIAKAPFHSSFLAASVWTGHELLAWANSAHLPGYSYDPGTDRWSAVPPAPLEGPSPLAVWTGVEALLVTGSGGSAAYEPVTGVWRSLPPPPLDVTSGQVMWTGSQLLAFEWPRQSAAAVLYASLDPMQNAWLDRGQAPLLNFQSDLAVWAGGHAVFLSGESSDADQAQPIQPGSLSSASLEPVADEWTALAGGCFSTNDAVSTGSLVLSAYGAFDPSTDRCLRMPSQPEQRRGYGRYGEVRLWTGSELLIWSGGGAEGLPPKPDGIAFEPAEP